MKKPRITKKKKADYWKEQCRANHEYTGNHYGWFRDTSGNDRVEQINPTACYPYFYRTDSDTKIVKP